ncbi:MAG TPA: hypothetical protein VFA38_00250 [Nitrospirales bacterium]|nr:hypothetical protein [Nitrospirales bacterium]
MSIRPAAIVLITLLVMACASSQPPDRAMMESPGVQDAGVLQYQREAQLYRDKSVALIERAALYERIFGPQSDWVIGTRMLAAFYEDEARDRERLAARRKESSHAMP